MSASDTGHPGGPSFTIRVPVDFYMLCFNQWFTPVFEANLWQFFACFLGTAPLGLLTKRYIWLTICAGPETSGHEPHRRRRRQKGEHHVDLDDRRPGCGRLISGAPAVGVGGGVGASLAGVVPRGRQPRVCPGQLAPHLGYDRVPSFFQPRRQL